MLLNVNLWYGTTLYETTYCGMLDIPHILQAHSIGSFNGKGMLKKYMTERFSLWQKLAPTPPKYVFAQFRHFPSVK